MGCGASKPAAYSSSADPPPEPQPWREPQPPQQTQEKVAAVVVPPGSGPVERAGERLLEHAKEVGGSGGPILAQLAFVLHAVSKAAAAVKAVRSDAMMFAACSWHVEQLSLHVWDMTAEETRAALFRVMDALEEASAHLRLLGPAGQVEARLAEDPAYELGTLGRVCATVRSDCELLAPAAEPALLRIFDGLRFRQSDKLDAKIKRLRAVATDTDPVEAESPQLGAEDENAPSTDAMAAQLERQAATRLELAAKERVALLQMQEELLRQQLLQLEKQHRAGLKPSTMAVRLRLPQNTRLSPPASSRSTRPLALHAPLPSSARPPQPPGF